MAPHIKKARRSWIRGPAGEEIRVICGSYFFTGAAEALVVGAAFLELAAFELVVLFLLGFVLFLWLLVVFCVVVVLVDEEDPEAAGVAVLGAWAANIIGTEATAKAIVAKIVFFIFSSPCGPCPLTVPSCGGSLENSIACAG